LNIATRSMRSAIAPTAVAFSLLLGSCDGKNEKPEDEAPAAAPTGDTLYLNIDNITVAEGEGSMGTLNNTVTLDNVIDAPTADAVEIHTQETHVWHTGEQLELVFDFQREYELRTVHFWNYFTDFYGVDTVELVFSSELNEPVGTMTLNPELGINNAIVSEDFDLAEPLMVRFVQATITNESQSTDFQNMGFTVTAPAAQ